MNRGHRLVWLLLTLSIVIIFAVGILLPKYGIKDRDAGVSQDDLNCSKFETYIALDHPLQRIMLVFGDLKMTGYVGKNIRIAALTLFGIEFASVEISPSCTSGGIVISDES